MTDAQPNGKAPSSARYEVGAKGGKVAEAWQWVWDRLDRETFRDGHQLAAEAAEVFHILPQSIQAHLHRMASEGVLETELRRTETTVFRYGKEHKAWRRRTAFRIAGEKL